MVEIFGSPPALALLESGDAKASDNLFTFAMMFIEMELVEAEFLARNIGGCVDEYAWDGIADDLSVTISVGVLR